ncbi:hypothetical protein EZV62_009772 [Acer yangbiense]|uniref:C3H1-type domain-containing protein n=1 Tax=Acer yangbiense TaxID=1000413 RepID=A0A5C7I1G3_9ROSI|nr:hypothetical protein EZV62_009772 [Acer yangbiense]
MIISHSLFKNPILVVVRCGVCFCFESEDRKIKRWRNGISEIVVLAFLEGAVSDLDMFFEGPVIMDVKASRRFADNKREQSVLNRVGARGGQRGTSNICYYYTVGRCNRNPCKFVHAEPPFLYVNPRFSKQDRPRKGPSHRTPKNVWFSSEAEDRITRDRSRKTPKINGAKNSMASFTGSGESGDKIGTQKTPEKICDFWVLGDCVKGDNCQFLHSWFRGDGFTMMAKLDGHKKAVSGIALPSGSDKLYSSSRDGTARVWDCHTGQCASVINLGAEVGSLICEGPWVFVGMPNVIKAWNIESSADFSLDGPVGQVYSMIVANEMLLAGTQDGDILAWKGSSETRNPFQLAVSMKGHIRPVICLAVGGNRLYSGSMDYSIKVWDLETLQSVMTLEAHADAVMSLLCWDQYLLSCSLDRTIKVWVANEGGNLGVAYTHKEEHGVLQLQGVNDAECKPVLLCACNDNSVHLYELPSFIERGRIFSKCEVRAIHIGPDGLFFTGDGTGMLSVWKLSAKPSGEASQTTI